MVISRYVVKLHVFFQPQINQHLGLKPPCQGKNVRSKFIQRDAVWAVQQAATTVKRSSAPRYSFEEYPVERRQLVPGSRKKQGIRRDQVFD